MKYRCLVLDHDDTVVKSTPAINYPSFLESLAILRPQIKLTYEEFLEYCYDPGFHSYLTDILHYTPEEVDFEFRTWQKYIETRIPDFYEGIAQVAERQKSEGGILCVVSHSSTKNIMRDYRAHCAVMPDLIFGYELGEDKRKPHPYPMLEILRTYDLRPDEVLMVDDLLPGLTMCKTCGVDFAYAGWTSTVPKIAQRMRSISGICLNSVSELSNLQFSK
ncbi:MAG: HAD hydrolase-like protein [Eubacteriales bacterium]|nr:HAD hydrolase-like protein [Eubacteriales bacterium]